MSPLRSRRISLRSAVVAAILGAAMHDLAQFGWPASTNTGTRPVVRVCWAAGVPDPPLSSGNLEPTEI